jgi:uncharacterized protein
MRKFLLPVALAVVAGLAAAQTAYLPSIGAGDVVMPVTSLRQARLAGTLLQQYDFSCGSAALATLLTHHYGRPISEQAVFEEMYARGDRQKIQREGFSLYDMKLFLAARGFEADGFEQPLEKLNEARVPAIVLVNENGYQHFVVVKGLQADRVLIGDPAQGTRALSRRAFDAIWTTRLLFVIHNRMDMARFNLAADWRVAPRAPLAGGVGRDGMAGITLPKQGPGDF